VGTRRRKRDPAAPARRALGRLWQWQREDRPLAPDATVTFAIPLIGRARAFDWAQVQRNLLWTIGALLNQTNPRWEAIVCGQDRPAGLDADARLSFLPFARTPDPARPSDQRPKMRAMRDAVAAQRGRDGYLVYLDADDIVHPELVAHCLGAGHRDGYAFSLGYMLDARSGALGYFGPPTPHYPHASPLWQACGTASAVRLDRRTRRALLPHRFRGSHSQQIARFAEFGMHLADLPFPAAIYAVNHGENMRRRRGKDARQLDYLAANRLDAAVAEQARAAFRIDALAAWVEGARPAVVGG